MGACRLQQQQRALLGPALSRWQACQYLLLNWCCLDSAVVVKNSSVVRQVQHCLSFAAAGFHICHAQLVLEPPPPAAHKLLRILLQKLHLLSGRYPPFRIRPHLRFVACKAGRGTTGCVWQRRGTALHRSSARRAFPHIIQPSHSIRCRECNRQVICRLNIPCFSARAKSARHMRSSAFSFISTRIRGPPLSRAKYWRIRSRTGSSPSSAARQVGAVGVLAAVHRFSVHHARPIVVKWDIGSTHLC